MPINCGAHRYGDTGEYFYKSRCPDCQKLNENTKYSRAFQLAIYVDRAWLTNDFELDEKGGWDELHSQLVTHLKRFETADIKVDYDGWMEDPVEEK